MQVSTVPFYRKEPLVAIVSFEKQEPWGRHAMFSDPDGNGWILRQPPR